jgi:hypothetical protein
MIMSVYPALLAASEEGWIKLVVPVVIGIFYIVSAIAKSKGGEQNESSKQGPAKPQKPQTQPARVAQRPVPRRYAEKPGPGVNLGRPHRQPMTPSPAKVSQRPQVAARPAPRAIPTTQPIGPGSIERSLKDKLAQASGLSGAIPIEKPAVAVMATQTPSPGEVQKVAVAGQTLLGSLETRLRNPAALREAIILREILDKPLALR